MTIQLDAPSASTASIALVIVFIFCVPSLPYFLVVAGWRPRDRRGATGNLF
jgi:hypothetical protein